MIGVQKGDETVAKVMRTRGKIRIDIKKIKYL
jgi:hypothetical protein